MGRRLRSQRSGTVESGTRKSSPWARAEAGRTHCKRSERPIESLRPGMTAEKSKLRIALGADHAAFHLKEALKSYLRGAGYECDDLGTSSEESVDYPDFARAVAERVAAGSDDLGVLACGTGIGMAIAANKIPGIRAATAHDA